MFGFLNMLQRWNLGVIRGSRLVPTRVPPRQTPLALPTPVPSAHSRLLSLSTSTATQEALCVPPWIYNKDNLYMRLTAVASSARRPIAYSPRPSAHCKCRLSSVVCRCTAAGRSARTPGSTALLKLCSDPRAQSTSVGVVPTMLPGPSFFHCMLSRYPPLLPSRIWRSGFIASGCPTRRKPEA